MYRPTMLLSAWFFVAACSDVRYGMNNVPLSNANSDAAALETIKRALPPEKMNCQIDLVGMSEGDQVSSSTIKQVATVKVCGKIEKYSIQRSQVKEDRVLIAAKRI